MGRKTRPRPGIGKPIPRVPVSATGDSIIRLGKLKGKPLVQYFYPKDKTSGCTLEVLDFRNRYIRFQKLGAAVFGVSRDGLAREVQGETRFSVRADLGHEAVPGIQCGQ